jgi:hypothetical protein
MMELELESNSDSDWDRTKCCKQVVPLDENRPGTRIGSHKHAIILQIFITSTRICFKYASKMQKICKKNVGKNASGKNMQLNMSENMQENMQENMKDSMQENMTNITNYLFCIFSENMLPLMT